MKPRLFLSVLALVVGVVPALRAAEAPPPRAASQPSATERLLELQRVAPHRGAATNMSGREASVLSRAHLSALGEASKPGAPNGGGAAPDHAP